ncbi:hypothetical protein PYR91_12005 [Sphaerisporangium sp. TRM90804]|nr:hypothetical protein [Sphaerisporangium sp. TRM90804]
MRIAKNIAARTAIVTLVAAGGAAGCGTMLAQQDSAKPVVSSVNAWAPAAPVAADLNGDQPWG